MNAMEVVKSLSSMAFRSFLYSRKPYFSFNTGSSMTRLAYTFSLMPRVFPECVFHEYQGRDELGKVLLYAECVLQLRVDVGDGSACGDENGGPARFERDKMRMPAYGYDRFVLETVAGDIQREIVVFPDRAELRPDSPMAISPPVSDTL